MERSLIGVDTNMVIEILILDDHSHNTLWVDFLMMGELYQNNHHKACRKWDFASKWYELDLTFLIMRLLNSAGIIRPIKS